MQLSVRSSTPPPRLNLFDTLSVWLASPELAYASWLTSRRLKDSSARVYIAMFGRFCQWLTVQGKKLDQLDADDIRRFLDSENPNLPPSRKARSNSGRQRQQYIRQLEHVFAHLGTLGHAGINPGREAGYDRVGAGADKPTRFLSGAESQAVIQLIQENLVELRKAEKGKDAWLEFRDLALIAAMIGGGIKVGQVGTMTLNCIHLQEGTIDLSRPGRAHRARLLPFAIEALHAWLVVQEERRGHRLEPAQKVFEASRSSGFGRNSKTIMLSTSSIHRRTQKLLTMAGITGDRACAQTLRNTYAGLLIDGGATDEQLVDYLGLLTTVTAQRLRASYAKIRPQKTA
jgi:site-specific recombinase XerD